MNGEDEKDPSNYELLRRASNLAERQPDISLPTLPGYATGGIPSSTYLPPFKPETLKKIAGQTRQLNKEERNYLKAKFGKGINPDNFRIGYDLGASGTNLAGWSDVRLPTAIFLPTDVTNTVDETLAHEATHGWQVLRELRDYGPGRTYEWELEHPDKPKTEAEFKALGREQQADLVASGDPTAAQYVRSHPASTLPRADEAFLDTIRQRYSDKGMSGLGPDVVARFGALGGVSHVGFRDGNPYLKGAMEQRKQPAPSIGKYDKMNGQDQQQDQKQQGDLGQRVPILDDSDPNNPRVTLVPPDQVDQAIRMGGKKVSTADYQRSLGQSRLAKPSAAVGTQPPVQQAGPGPVGGQQVPGAPGVTTTSPGGQTKLPGQTLGASATGTGAGIPLRDPGQMEMLRRTGVGIGQEAERQGRRILGAFGVISPSAARGGAPPPTLGPEALGAKSLQFAENFLPLGATEKIGATATDVLAENAPRVAQWAEIPVGLVSRMLYNIGVEGTTAKLQGRDPAESAKIALLFSAITEPAAMAAPWALQALYGVKQEMGTRLGRRMLEMREPTGPWTEWATDPIKKIREVSGRFGPFTLKGFNARAEILYDSAAKEVNRVAALASTRPTVNYPRTKVPAYGMLQDIEDAMNSSWGKDRGYLKRMLVDVEKTIKGFAPGSKLGALSRESELKKTVQELRDKLYDPLTGAQRPSRLNTQLTMEAYIEKQRQLKELQKAIRNIPVEMSPSQINKLRRGIGDNYVNWGKANAELSQAESYAKKLYNQVSGELTKALRGVDPNIKEVIDTENAMRDIWKGTAREQHVGIGIHSLGKGGTLPKVAGVFGGWELGRRFGGIPGGMAGAIIGSKAANPLVSGMARAAHSGLVRGVPLAAAETFGTNYPNQDWSAKGKKTPYGPME